MSELWRRLCFLFNARRYDGELEEEMRIHVEMQAEAHRAAGMEREEARYLAARRFGNATLLREQSGDAWGWRPFERLWQDIRYTVRVLRRNPTFTVVAVVTLGLAIGANTAIFSAIYALLLRPSSLANPERLVFLDARHSSGKNQGAGYRDFLDWRAQNTVFEEMTVLGWSADYTLAGAGDPQRLIGRVVSHTFPRVIGVQPALGRFFTEDEDRPGQPRVAVLSYPAWQGRFGGRADVLGSVVTLNENPYTIIGVMPKNFVFPGMSLCDFWAALRENPNNERYQHQYSVLARMKPGVTGERAQADMATIARRLEEQYPETNSGWRVDVVPLARAMAPEVRTGLLVVFSVVLFVLVLACANLAGLLLARASRRAKEIAVRASLGANRARIVRQMLTESILLAGVGGVSGLVFASWLMRIMRAVGPPDAAFEVTLQLNGTVLTFTAAVSLLTGLLFGIAPAIYGSRTDLNTALKGGAGAGSNARSRNRFLSALVAGEVALSMVLLAGACLLAKDFLFLLHTDTGVRTSNVLTFALELPRRKYPAERARAFYDELLQKLRTAPGVEAAATVQTLPLSGNYSGGPFEIEGRPKPADWMQMSTQYNGASAGYFATVGIPILRGRDFDSRDTLTSAPVVIINDALARSYFPNEDPIGRRIKTMNSDWQTIIGVVGSAKHAIISHVPDAQTYVAQAQSSGRSLQVMLRTAGEPARSAALVRATVRSLDPGLPVLDLRTMQQVVLDSLSNQTLMISFMSAFAAFALLLATIGIYGVIAYSVNQRTQEIGVRMALGATPGTVLRMVLRRGVLLAGIGVLLGLPAAFAAARVVGSLLYGVSPRDASVFAGVPLLLLFVAFAATYIPARRAARVDPLTTLRSE